MFGRLGPWEIGFILIIVLIIFGAGKLPQIGEALGKGIRAFKKSQTGEEEAKPAASTDLKEKPKTDATKTA